MSVLIRGMKMPKKYPVTVTIFPDGITIAKTISGRRFTATAIPVKPHGDLVERKAVEELALFVQSTDDDKIIWLSDLNTIPTIIPAEPAEEAEE